MHNPRFIVGEILDKGLSNSTWREQHPEAYTALLDYREDLILSFVSDPNEEYHFFTSSLAYWRTSSSLYKCMRDQRKADQSLNNFKVKGFNIYMVPLPNDKDHPYDINNYTPQVEGTEWIHFEEYK